MPALMPKKLLLLLFITALNACTTVQVPNLTVYSAVGPLDQGAVGAETNTGILHDLDEKQFINFLVPQNGNPGAVCMSSDDALKQTININQMCRLLGPKCTITNGKVVMK